MDHPSLPAVVLATPRRAGLPAAADSTVEVLVRIQAAVAPAGGTAQRPPQALALVIDRSGSMSGRPLAEAMRCASHVVSRLRADDVAALVAFDNRVQRLHDAQPVGDGQALRRAIAGIRSGGNTALHGGWLEGAQALEALPSEGLRRVILLSDGQANEGVTDTAEIASQVDAWRERGITTSTYGLGNHFNEDLMVEMARRGGGSSYYGETAEDLMEPFEQELSLLENLCLREPVLRVTVPEGVEVRMVNPLPAVEAEGRVAGWRLPDLAWGSEAWAVLELKVSRSGVPPLGRLMELLRVQVEGRGLDGNPVQLERASLLLRVLPEAERRTLVEDATVASRIDELAAAEAMLAVREAARQADWTRAEQVLAEAERRFASHAWLAAMLEATRELVRERQAEGVLKETRYSSSKLARRLASIDESTASLADAVEVPAFLRRKTRQGKGEA